MRDQVRNKLKKRKPEEDKEQSDVQPTKETSGKRLTKQFTALQFVEILQKLTDFKGIVSQLFSKLDSRQSLFNRVCHKRTQSSTVGFGGIPVCHSKPTFQAVARSLVSHAAICQFVSRKLICQSFRHQAELFVSETCLLLCVPKHFLELMVIFSSYACLHSANRRQRALNTSD